MPHQKLTSHSLPRHVSIVMDGNGRWAKKRLLPRVAGHRAGMKRVRELIEYSGKIGIEVLTLYAFSHENWRRPPEEIDTLMDLFIEALETQVQELHANQVQLAFIGDRAHLKPNLIKGMEQAEQLTQHNSGLKLRVAINYGSRQELAEAVSSIAKLVQSGTLSAEDINPDLIDRYLYTWGLPDVDLWIRTSGERRLSNFLLWQVAYGELYFTETLFPAFDVKAYQKALSWFQERERRFGMTSEQLKEDE